MNPINPVVISTWYHGEKANESAARVLSEKGSALDAVVAGAAVSEEDPDVMDVGYGGLPDEDGTVTLDAAVVGSDGRSGSVAGMEGVVHAAAVARKVMEETKHAMIVGEGAKRFAIKMGFEEKNLLSEEARHRWLEWKKDPEKPTAWLGEHSLHETLGIVAMDQSGDLAGACTTSGEAWKIHGRVGDSPIIGAGLYVDNGVGGAAATGAGKEIISVCGSFLIVEKMRGGMSPQEACEHTLRRIIDRHGGDADFQVGFVALRKDGETGAASIQRPFEFALFKNDENRLIKAKAILEKQTDFYKTYLRNG
jgi:isoaspartyl peptidase/L-asparaginase-like protein (Ntn-hydrolase superfamily)